MNKHSRVVLCFLNQLKRLLAIGNFISAMAITLSRPKQQNLYNVIRGR